MEHLLNRDAYKVEYDNIIYDTSHPISVNIIEMESPATILKRGTILGLDKDGGYFILGTTITSGETVTTIAGEAVAVVQDTIDCTKETGKVTVPVYVSGKVNKNYLVTAENYELTDTDIIALRKNGIYVAESMK